MVTAMTDRTETLKRTAIQIRRDIMDIAAHCGNGTIHVGPALSCTDIVTALYFDVMNVDPQNPLWEGRDRFVMSKGHAYPALYSALAERGYFPREELLTTRRINSRLQGHPALGKTPGVDMTSGSLGNGLSCGLGIAWALKLQKKNAHVFVLLGDGELQEGAVWEAAMSAPNHRIDNLTAIVDYNHLQSGGSVENINDLHPLADKWRSFGWKVFEIDGHDIDEITDRLRLAKTFYGRPVCIISHTVKGKGISFTEHDNSWHSRTATQEEFEIAMKELDVQEEALGPVPLKGGVWDETV